MADLSELYGADVFDFRNMKEALSEATYQKIEKTIKEGLKLDESIANEVASAMKNWAISKGATHYTHWFQPMTGITAEKHEGFIEYSGEGAGLMEFSGKALIKGEPDASSFPSGGLRSTFEARGYTAWDPTSFAFVKDKILYIPTAFCSYSGEALDKKTPLLRSMDALNKQALRVLRLLGDNTAKKVTPMVGPEQEYFLIDKKLYNARKDLIYTGRTLFGNLPPKGQELEDHYFGSINPRVQAFMDALNNKLWRLGIPAKTEHNEVAPAQYELAPVYEKANVACDHNQLTMEVMKKVAEKHDFVCLFHEKPFAGVNGSGKHNNWSIGTDTGVNLLSPGKTPFENKQFLIFLTAVIKAVDDYQDLIRASIASAANDHRLGANEAPPAIVSMFLGDELTAVVEAIKNDASYVSNEKKLMKLGVSSLPVFSRDTTDRNRTSPIAFTGNKFEFRTLGSSDSIACLNIMINSAVADTLRLFADELEKADNFDQALQTLMKREITAHQRIIFNGNGYDESWVKEAEKRGLLNLKNTPAAIKPLIDQKNIDMLGRMNVYNVVELNSRYLILLDNYCKTIVIEAKTMVDIVNKDILPSIDKYLLSLAKSYQMKNAILGEKVFYEQDLIKQLSNISNDIYEQNNDLNKIVASLNHEDLEKEKDIIVNTLLPKMNVLRKVVDAAEALTAEEDWPMPNYGQIMFTL